MEKDNLQLLSLYMDSDLVFLPEEKDSFSPPLENNSESFDVMKEEIENLQEHEELIFDGEFNKKIMIVFEGDELSVDCHEFLYKLISAINCSIKDVAIFSSHDFEKAKAQQILDLDAQKIIVFGKVRHELFNFTKKEYEIIVLEQVEYLFADNLNSIIEDVSLKKALWNKLKTLFNLN
jgi:precorrin-6B methylase 1